MTLRTRAELAARDICEGTPTDLHGPGVCTICRPIADVIERECRAFAEKACENIILITQHLERTKDSMEVTDVIAAAIDEAERD